MTLHLFGVCYKHFRAMTKPIIRVSHRLLAVPGSGIRDAPGRSNAWKLVMFAIPSCYMPCRSVCFMVDKGERPNAA